MNFLSPSMTFTLAATALLSAITAGGTIDTGGQTIEPSIAQIREVVAREFGAPLEVMRGSGRRGLSAFVGDFNGDGSADLAVYVSSEAGPKFRLMDGVKVSAPKEKSLRRRGDPVYKFDPRGERFEALAVIHGGPSGWGVGPPADKYLLGYVGYPDKLYKKFGTRPSKYRVPPAAKGDALMCLGEGGGDGLLYFDGVRYRYKLVITGD